MRKLNNKGVSAWAVVGIAMMVVVGVIFLSIMLPVGLGISQSTAQLFNYPKTIDGIGQSAYVNATNTTLTTVNSNIAGGFNLLAISPIVLAAGGVISILVAAFAVVLTREGGF
jgi:hypothetical protein